MDCVNRRCQWCGQSRKEEQFKHILVEYRHDSAVKTTICMLCQEELFPFEGVNENDERVFRDTLNEDRHQKRCQKGLKSYSLKELAFDVSGWNAVYDECGVYIGHKQGEWKDGYNDETEVIATNEFEDESGFVCVQIKKTDDDEEETEDEETEDEETEDEETDENISN